MVLQVLAPSGRERHCHQALRRLTRPLASASDVVQCFVLVDATNPRRIHYVEEWTDPESMYRELRTARFQALLAFMEGSASTPSLRFRTVTECGGLELVTEARRRVPGPPLPSKERES